MLILYKYPSLVGYGFDLDEERVYVCHKDCNPEPLPYNKTYTIGWVIYAHEQLHEMALDELPRYEREENGVPFILIGTIAYGGTAAEHYDGSISISAAVEDFSKKT